MSPTFKYYINLHFTSKMYDLYSCSKFYCKDTPENVISGFFFFFFYISTFNFQF